MHIGEQGYLQNADDILNVVLDFKSKLSYVPELKIIGNPIGPVVAVMLKKHPERIYYVLES